MPMQKCCSCWLNNYLNFIVNYMAPIKQNTKIRKIGSYLISLLAISLCSLTLSSCSPVKGYVGPDLPENQVSAIFLNYESDSAEINQAGIEGTAFGGSGIHVLPGKHVFDLDITVKERPDNCYSYPKFDDYGYEQCLKKKDDRDCYCYDYMEIYQRCYQQVRDGNCSGKFQTKAGYQYDIRTTKHGQSANVSVYERGGRGEVGHGQCEMGSWRTETNDEYMGKGKSTANAYGIHRCY